MSLLDVEGRSVVGFELDSCGLKSLLELTLGEKTRIVHRRLGLDMGDDARLSSPDVFDVGRQFVDGVLDVDHDSELIRADRYYSIGENG